MSAGRIAAAATGVNDMGNSTSEPGQPATLAPIVLLHAGSPWQENGGSVFLDAIAEHCGRPCVHAAISLEGHAVEVPRGFPRPVVQAVARGGVRGFGVLRDISPWLERQIYWGVVSPRSLVASTRRIARQLAALRPCRLAVFLNSIEMPIVAAELARQLDIPYVTMEWDLMEVAVDRLDLAGPIRRRAVGALQALRRGAVRRGVASEGMESMYRERWGLDAIVLRQPARAINHSRPPDPRRPMVIAVCGNIYAVDEFRSFVRALDSLGWAVEGRALELLVIGPAGNEVGPLPAQVRVTGWVPFAESLQYLRTADLGYCPYWFDERQADIVATSFPSKLISYLSCGVPVFYHGPANGSPAKFLTRYPAGVVCTTKDAGTISTEVARFLTSPDRLLLARRAAEAALTREFSLEILQERMAVWLSDRNRVQ